MTVRRWLDHTADVGADLVANDLPGLFRGAVDALVAVMLETPPVAPDGERTIRLDAPSREQLLVRWLEEWVFLVQSARRVPVESEIELRENAEGWHLEAMVRDATLDPVEHGWLGEVKGATFHDLEIERDGNQWHARVVFDV